MFIGTHCIRVSMLNFKIQVMFEVLTIVQTVSTQIPTQFNMFYTNRSTTNSDFNDDGLGHVYLG